MESGDARPIETGDVAIDFRDAIKAQIAQAVLAALLERCGYRITRLGIEELFREVKFKELAQYRELALPAQLLQVRWRRLSRLQHVFSAFSDSKSDRALADFVTLALKSLAKL
jgi:hypothetical protein